MFTAIMHEKKAGDLLWCASPCCDSAAGVEDESSVERPNSREETAEMAHRESLNENFAGTQTFSMRVQVFVLLGLLAPSMTTYSQFIECAFHTEEESFLLIFILERLALVLVALLKNIVKQNQNGVQCLCAKQRCPL